MVEALYQLTVDLNTGQPVAVPIATPTEPFAATLPS